jgi:hypothetical protein
MPDKNEIPEAECMDHGADIVCIIGGRIGRRTSPVASSMSPQVDCDDAMAAEMLDNGAPYGRVARIAVDEHDGRGNALGRLNGDLSGASDYPVFLEDHHADSSNGSQRTPAPAGFKASTKRVASWVGILADAGAAGGDGAALERLKRHFMVVSLR